jgi:SET domain-containing protein
VPVGLEIKEGRHGRGVFAARRFDKGEPVESCPTLELPSSQVTGLLNDYVFGSNEGEDQVLLLLGFGMLYNHSAEPNLEYVQDEPNVITFVTIKPVEAGEELTIDYGEEWWETRNREPDR